MDQENSFIEENKEQLDEINEISKDIERSTQELNDTFSRLEDTLRNKLNVGVTAWCSKILSPTEEGWGYKFGYCRINRDWKLVCRKIYLDKEDDENGYYGYLTPINIMSRKVRIEATELIPELIGRLKEKSVSFKTTISDAVTTLEKIDNKINENY